MKRLGEVLRLSLNHVGNARPRHEVELLIARVLKTSRLDLYLQFDRPLNEEELSQIRCDITRLRKSEPFAYVCGKAAFFRDEFLVSKDVLIPRPETEILVEQARKFLAARKDPGILFDICTGTGCVGLSLKKLFPSWEVVLSDISPEALSVAKQNADMLQVQASFLEGDLLAPFVSRKAHCILANPPYLSLDEWEKADGSIRAFEPKIALVGGITGLEWYERFFCDVKNYVYNDAALFVEIGSTQASSVVALAKKYGFPEVSVIKDLSGHDRVISVFPCN